MPVMLLVPQPAQTTIGVLQLCRRPLQVAISCGSGTGLARSPEVTQAIGKNGAKPAAKGTGAPIVLKLWQFADDDCQHVLHQVVGIGRLQMMATQPVAQERRVQLHQPCPRPLVGLLAKSLQQADRCLGHGQPPPTWTTEGGWRSGPPSATS